MESSMIILNEESIIFDAEEECSSTTCERNKSLFRKSAYLAVTAEWTKDRDPDVVQLPSIDAKYTIVSCFWFAVDLVFGWSILIIVTAVDNI